MKNKINFYTTLISTILDSYCSYIVTVDNSDIKLISFFGNKPFDLDTLNLVVNNFDIAKKSFSIIEVNEFKNTIKNENFNLKNTHSIGYLPLLDENKITIGYLITSFNKPFDFKKNQEKTVGLIATKISEKLRKNRKDEECHIVNNELLHQTDQKAKYADELIITKKEQAFQNEEKHKRAEELLIANKELDFLNKTEHALFASIVNSSEDAMLSKTLDGTITSWNYGAEKIFGYSADEIIGKNVLTLIPPQLQQEEVYIVKKIQNGETVDHYETKRIRKDGTTFHASLTISPIRNFEGNIIGASKVLRDITKQKEKEQQLKLFASVATKTNDSILITEAEPFDEPGPRILYVNDAFTKMTGYTAEEVIGKTPRILQGPKSDKVELARIRKAVQNWESYETTIINYKKNGEEFWINFSITPVADENGGFSHWIAKERDVTLRKNEELQNELIADISNVFSEPLKLHETLDRILRYIANFGDFCFAEAWLTSSDQNILNKISSHAGTENMRLFLEETNAIDTFIYGEGFSGIVAKTKEITIWGDLANHKEFIRRDAAVKYGLKTKIGLPLVYNKEVVGVLAFGLDHDIVDAAKYRTLLKKLGDYLSPEIKRKKLEVELNQMFNFAPDLIAIIGLDGYFKRVNPAACELLGYTKEELCAEPYANFIHPEDKEKSTNEIATLLATNLTYYFENRYITKSGKIKWLAWDAIYVYEDNNIYAVSKDITDKKELEELLQKANELARIGGWEVDLLKGTVYWSDITREIHEAESSYVPDLATGINFYKEGPDRDLITQKVKEAVELGKPWDVELQIVTVKNNVRWIRTIGQAEFVNGNCIRIYGCFQDIHERKIVEQQKNSLLTTLEKSLNEIYIFDAATLKFSFVNQGALLNNGYSEQEIKDLTPLDLKPEFTVTAFNQLVNPLVTKEKEKIIFFTNHKRKNGSFYPVEVHLQLVAEGNNKRFLAVILDITERKKAKEELINIEERRKLIMNAALDAIICIDKEGMITFWNPQAEQIFGWSENEVMGKVLSAIIIPEHLRSMHDNGMKNYLKTGEGKAINVLLQLSAIRRNGTEFPIELTVLPIHQDGEEFFCAFIRDITERKTYEEKLLKLNKSLNKQKAELITSNKELEQFAFVASHDLQEPLRMVTSFLTQLENKYENVLDEKGKKYIFFAVDGAKRMRQIILDLLEFSTVVKKETKLEEVDVNAIVEEIKLLYQKQIEEKKAQIHFERLPKIRAYTAPIKQVFQNLISNALKYSNPNEKPVITISCKKNAASWEFEIKDNGIGISQDYFDKIFIIFQRLHKKEEYSGTGMGLAITKKIIENLRGQIWVKSEEGKGTSFYFTIPKK